MSKVVFHNTETGCIAEYVIPGEGNLVDQVERMIDLMESTMARRFTPIERKWLRQDNIHPLPIEVEFKYEFDDSYESNDWRDWWFNDICESISGYGYGWIAAYIPLRWMLTNCDDDNEIEIIAELFKRDKISSPYSFYRAAYCECIDYDTYEDTEHLVKSAVRQDIDCDSWIANHVCWDSAAEALLDPDWGGWYYNEDSWIGIDMTTINTNDYDKASMLIRQGLCNHDEEFITLEEFVEFNKPPLEPITLEEIMTFLGGGDVE